MNLNCCIILQKVEPKCSYFHFAQGGTEMALRLKCYHTVLYIWKKKNTKKEKERQGIHFVQWLVENHSFASIDGRPTAKQKEQIHLELIHLPIIY